MGKDNFFHKRKEGRKKREEATRSLRAGQQLILAEGKKTEVNYFEGLVAYLNETNDSSIKIKSEGLGKDPKSVVEEYDKHHNKTRIPYYKTIFVFDKDSFGANNFNGAISKAESYEDSIVAWSNESFELWLYLHFKDIDTMQTRHWYNDKLTEIFRKEKIFIDKQNWEDNGKSDPEIFQKILQAGGCFDRAIGFAKKLFEEHTANGNLHSPAKANPATMVYKAVEALIKESELNNS